MLSLYGIMYNKYLKLRNLISNMFATQDEFKEEEHERQEFHLVLDSLGKLPKVKAKVSVNKPVALPSTSSFSSSHQIEFRGRDQPRKSSVILQRPSGRRECSVQSSETSYLD